MKVLLDENLPHQLRTALAGHDAITVQYLGWNGLKNGALLRTAEDAGFQVFLTSDQGVKEQQNMKGRKLGLVVLSEQEWKWLRDHLATIVAAIERCTPESVQFLKFDPQSARWGD